MGSFLESRIDAVTVHRRGAIVSRVVALGGEPRAGTVRVGPLPLDLDDGSVRVSVEPPQVDLRATDLRVVLVAPDADEALAPARPEDLREAEAEVERLRDALLAVRRERGRFAGIGAVGRPSAGPGTEPPASPAEARVALLSLRDQRLAEADERRRALARELREAEKRLADLRERERRATSARRTEPDELRKAVEVTLRGDGAGAARLRIEYRVEAARWAPTYALRLDAAMETATLEVRAMVAQRTGEDWSGASLALSTAELGAWMELPELASLRIGRAQPRPPKSGWRPPPSGAERLFEDWDRARPAAASTQFYLPPEEAPADELRSTGEFLAEDAGHFDLRAELLAEEEQLTRAPAPRQAPPPPAAPMRLAAPQSAPMPPAPERARAKSAGIGGLLGGAADALASSLAGDGPTTATLALDALAAESVDEALLDYGRLRMPAPTAPGRGKLVLTAWRALYVEQLETLRVEVDLGAAIAAAERRRAGVLDAALPPGCRPPHAAGFDYVYRAAGRLDAPSDGAFHNLGLSSEASEARARFVVVPRESRDAFRFVELDNPLDAPLLPGPVDVFIGGDFLLTSELAEVPEGGVLRLGLGVEQRLKVSRNARFSEKSGGLMGGKLDLLHAIDVELENLLPREARVEVRERIPVVREEEDDIRVEVGAVSPAWEEWEPDEQPELEGGRRWQVAIPAGEKRTLSAAYAIRIASKHELVGGNRRES